MDQVNKDGSIKHNEQLYDFKRFMSFACPLFVSSCTDVVFA